MTNDSYRQLIAQATGNDVKTLPSGWSFVAGSMAGITATVSRGRKELRTKEKEWKSIFIWELTFSFFLFLFLFPFFISVGNLSFRCCQNKACR